MGKLILLISFGLIAFSATSQSYNSDDLQDLQDLLEELERELDDNDYSYEEETYEKPNSSYISNSDTLFSPHHQSYLEEEQEVVPFDREYYERLVEAMVLKSKGSITIDMDRLDPNFNPDDYVWDDEYREYEYIEGDEYYVEDWDEYYYDDYRQFRKYEEEDRYEVKRIEKERERRLNGQINTPEPQGGGMSVILIIIMAVLIGGLLVYLFLSAPKDTEVKKAPIDDLAPTEIPKSELEIMLEKALADQDYRRAIRIYFIFIMKDLSEKGWIVWQKKKTNALYLREMRNKPFYEDFYKVVSIYEVAWYGKREITEADYKSVEPILQQLLNNLERHK